MRRLVLLCAIGVAALSACGDNSVQQPAASVPVVTAGSASAVPASLAFSAPRVGGGTLDMAQYAGKPVLLWFWAPT
ncbi:MAG: hypothetical protein ABI862_20775 [Ilumatobacteraceae bacterium]